MKECSVVMPAMRTNRMCSGWASWASSKESSVPGIGASATRSARSAVWETPATGTRGAYQTKGMRRLRSGG
jgi:hypothetical protein